MKEIIDNYKNNIRKIIRNMIGQNNEDIEQEVYIKTWKNLDKYSETGKFKSWLNTITANICRDYLKSSSFKKSQITTGDEQELLNVRDEGKTPESEFLQKQRQKSIIDAINSLKPKYKEIIVMYEIKELSYEEISKMINKPVGTVKSRLFNARRELSIILEDLI